MGARENKIADLVNRKFGVMTAMLLCFVDRQNRSKWNIDRIFGAWRTRKPSRSTFSQIIYDMESVGWVKKLPGTKKSEYILAVDSKKIIDDIGLKPDFGTHATQNCWLFSLNFFDRESLFDEQL